LPPPIRPPPPRRPPKELPPLRHDNPDLYGDKTIVGSVNLLTKSPPRRPSPDQMMGMTTMDATTMGGTSIRKRLKIKKIRTANASLSPENLQISGF